ncbi:MAG TPA: nuclear transport factor 2 family protein [Bryobacteraceae bacterium]|jgi:predicted SnoaL-like aldol condensation-catalyzing enzyme|nr:nuclear transport factor 2 family protein [Bryobacteraceae bacterium]
MSKVSNQIATPEGVVSDALMDLRNGRFVDASAHFAEVFKYTDHGTGLEFKDRDQLTAFFSKARELYPDSLLTASRVFTSGDYVIVEWTLQATITVPIYGGMSMEFPISVQGSSIVQTQEGKIINWADYYDGLKSRRTALTAHFQGWFEL